MGLAPLLLRLYPRSWRRRYGAEMRELLESRRLTLRTATDLVAGAIDARLNPEWAPAAAGSTDEGDTMTLGKWLRCAPSGVSAGDQWRSAGWMIGTCLGLMLLSLAVTRRIGANAFSESLLLSAFPAALMMSSESLYFRRYSRAARWVLSVGSALFIILITWAAAASN